MASRWEWGGVWMFGLVSALALAFAIWQTRVDASVFERYFGGLPPVAVMAVAIVAGAGLMAYLQGRTDFAVVGPRSASAAAVFIAWSVPVLAVVAIGADVVLRFPEDTNVASPDALRFYPTIAVLVEIVLHLAPIVVLVALLGMPTGLDASFARIAIPVALIEALLQAAYASTVGTSIFSAVHLLVFGVIQVWVFWRFGFVWMLGFRLAYYLLWHVLWGAARLRLLF